MCVLRTDNRPFHPLAPFPATTLTPSAIQMRHCCSIYRTFYSRYQHYYQLRIGSSFRAFHSCTHHLRNGPAFVVLRNSFECRLNLGSDGDNRSRRWHAFAFEILQGLTAVAISQARESIVHIPSSFSMIFFCQDTI